LLKSILLLNFVFLVCWLMSLRSVTWKTFGIVLAQLSTASFRLGGSFDIIADVWSEAAPPAAPSKAASSRPGSKALNSAVPA